MYYPSLIGHSAELARIIKKSSQPADVITSDYLRSKKYIGSNDRKFISELVFFTLRSLSLVTYAAEKSNSLVELLAKDSNSYEISIICAAIIFGAEANFALFENSPLKITDVEDVIRTIFKEKCGIDEHESNKWISCCLLTIQHLIGILEGRIEDKELVNTSYCLPNWIINSLTDSGKTLEQIRELSHSLLYPAQVTLRVRNPHENRAKVSNILQSEGVNNHFTRFSPAGIVLDKRTSLTQHPLYKEGIIEIQDEGSQLISYALDPEPTGSVLDACAGAGGKTLHIADLQNDKGTIVATDIEYKRLKEISIRASRAGYSSIESVLIQSNGDPKRYSQKYNRLFDSVLVDAPCSGLGTTRRMPMAKWRSNPSLIAKLATNQIRILEYNAKKVCKNGSLLYATCSILPQENEEIAKLFLEHNPNFIPEPILPSFLRHGITIPSLKAEDNFLTLYPSVNGTDGFFMAKFRRID